MHGGVSAVKLQRLAISLAGEPGVDVAQILMGRGVTGIGAYRHFKRGPGLVKLALTGIEHGQVVVGLGQLGVVFGDFCEGGNRVASLAGFGLYHAPEKAHLRVARLRGQVLVSLGEGFGVLIGADQTADIGIVVGMGERA